MYYHQERSLLGETKIEATEALRIRSHKMQESEEEVLIPPKSTYQMSQVSDRLKRVCACESQQAETWPASRCDYRKSIQTQTYIRQRSGRNSRHLLEMRV